MIVVSDTTPLRYLAVLDGLEWLNRLFGEVACPPEVIAECKHKNAPAPLREWAMVPPSWLRVIAVSEQARALPIATGLDVGETAALCLAVEIQADLVLLDERLGRAGATTELGLMITGTLGVLVEAGLRGIIDFEQELTRLRELTNFRVDEQVIALARRRLAVGLKTPNEPQRP